MPQPSPEKLEKLRRALEAYESGDAGGQLIDAEAEAAKAPVRSRALGLLDQRARSRKELRDRLVAADFEPEVVDTVVDDLAGVGLVDDEAFAKEWVRQRHARRGKSARALNLELKEKGVEAADRAIALEQITEESEEAVARQVAEKKVRTLKRVPADRHERDKFLRRIVGTLARRGYNQELVMRISIEVLDARIAELKAL
ncbi:MULTISPECIES: recombination regulator RecX [Corynebacterium]|uniref:Regulatory protein RecX n=1 Tax=Corynebacterium aurimucosum TaxID=169292 RepID=A0A558GKC8_9CORY|nr:MULTISPECIES: recombination regulator RecX [unclassified Corynebacterium]OFL24868.1 recombinase RecX [Corynebacterium sp. HMSC062A03]OFP25014.1 recombinase RecX [Corynebacterium sp. HMSC066C02]OFT65086.1 recombination regulator RecX [Corynebacterium sp. HMSC05D03]TVU57305.1 recombination regulator RecX [Corynebacterium aurimucosum]